MGLRTRISRFWVALAAVPFLTILVFWNLYVVHDYYLVAISPIPAAALGFGFARLWQAHRRARVPTFPVALLGVWIAAVLAVVPAVWTLGYRDIGVSDVYPEVTEVTALTLPTDLVVFDGYGWGSEVPYYSRRMGRMTRSDPREQLSARELAADGYRVLVTRRLESELAADMVRTGRWTGVLGNFVFITGEDKVDLRGAPLVATDEVVERGAPLVDGPLTVACGGGGVLLPRSEGGTILQLAPETPRTAKLSLVPGYGDVPARAFVTVQPGSGAEQITLSCRDAVSITVHGVYGVPSTA